MRRLQKFTAAAGFLAIGGSSVFAEDNSFRVPYIAAEEYSTWDKMLPVATVFPIVIADKKAVSAIITCMIGNKILSKDSHIFDGATFTLDRWAVTLDVQAQVKPEGPYVLRKGYEARNDVISVATVVDGVNVNFSVSRTLKKGFGYSYDLNAAPLADDVKSLPSFPIAGKNLLAADATRYDPAGAGTQRATDAQDILGCIRPPSTITVSGQKPAMR